MNILRSTTYYLLGLLVLLVVLAMPNGLQAGKPGTDIEITLKNYKRDTVVLANYFGDKKYVKDSLPVRNGKVHIEADTLLPGGVYLMVLLPKRNYFEFIIDEPAFQLTVDTQKPIKSMKVRNSKENRLFYDFMQQTSDEGKKIGKLNRRIQQLQSKGDSAAAADKREQLQKLQQKLKDRRTKLIEQHPNTLVAKFFGMMQDPEVPEPPKDVEDKKKFRYIYYKNHYLNNIDFQDPRYLRTPVFHNRVMNYFDKVVAQQPDSIIQEVDRVLARAQGNRTMFQYMLSTLLNKYLKSKVMGFDKVYVHILEKYYLKGRAPWVSNEQLKKMAKEVNAKQRTFVGDVAPELQLYDLEHKMHSLHNQMNEYTILFFYDPDCGHCKDAAPKIAKLHKKYKDMGVGLFAVCIKNDTAKMRDFIEKYNLNGVNVADLTLQSNMRKKYDLRSTPVKFILNYDKEIVTKQLGARQMDQFLARKLDVEPGGVVPDKKKKQQKEDQAQNPDHSSNGTPTPNRASTR